MQPTTPTVFPEIPMPRPDESRYSMDNRLYVEFYRKAVQHEAKSRDAGRAIYDEVDYVRIHTPGDKSSVIERPVSAMDAERFADRYSKWKAGQEEAVSGTPLTAMAGMTPAKVEEYRFFKITTIEQLADAADNLGQKFMGFQGDKARAKAFVELANNNAPLEKMNVALQERDATIEALTSRIDAMQQQLGKLSKKSAATADVD